MLRKENKQMNILSMLYSKIPEDHILPVLPVFFSLKPLYYLVDDVLCMKCSCSNDSHP